MVDHIAFYTLNDKGIPTGFYQGLCQLPDEAKETFRERIHSTWTNFYTQGAPLENTKADRAVLDAFLNDKKFIVLDVEVASTGHKYRVEKFVSLDMGHIAVEGGFNPEKAVKVVKHIVGKQKEASVDPKDPMSRAFSSAHNFRRVWDKLLVGGWNMVREFWA